MEKISNRKFSFNWILEDKKSIKESTESKPFNINTPKFSVLKEESSENEKIGINSQSKPDDNFQTIEEVISNNKTSNINNCEERVIDEDCKVWEYTYESVEYGEEEPSYDLTDQSDTISGNTIKNEGINEITHEGIDIDKNEKSLVKVEKKPLNDVEKKTSSMEGKNKLKKKQIKEIPYIKLQGLEKKKELINEWKIVSVREIEAAKVEDDTVLDTTFYNRNISSDYIIQYIEKSDNEVFVPKAKFSFFKFFFRCFRVKTESLSLLNRKKQKLLKFSNESFSPTKVQHISMAKRIYTLLKNDDSCPIFGDHWKNIGFQGNSPGTDLRKSGVFGLLCLLYFVEKYPSISFKIHKYSIDISQKCHFASTCIFFAEIALIALKDNTLYEHMEKAKKVYEVILDYFSGMVIFWFRYYKDSKKKTVEIMKSIDYVGTYAKKNVDEILRLTKYKFS
ncbi:hypothetical protein SteCoe_1349 [Stentor coeruleus]|uniref:ELMO domain-containing protein n=1 Tax=Stentor coeruleus TaxID=5963 RepID=A0A1R2D222_9CILI|nr:hypothetical protein SteCoe_1349 [Stentor coeruleus]